MMYSQESTDRFGQQDERNGAGIQLPGHANAFEGNELAKHLLTRAWDSDAALSTNA
jgi:hypothetical protein